MSDRGLFSYRRYRDRDARLDAMIADFELRAAGVIEDDEPSEYSHYAYMHRLEREATAEFTPAERAEIRTRFGLAPFDG